MTRKVLSAIALAVLAAATVFGANDSRAAPLTFQFSATVTDTGGFGLSNGQVIQGLYTIDPALPPVSSGTYRPAGLGFLTPALSGIVLDAGFSQISAGAPGTYTISFVKVVGTARTAFFFSGFEDLGSNDLPTDPPPPGDLNLAILDESEGILGFVLATVTDWSVVPGPGVALLLGVTVLGLGVLRRRAPA